MYVKDENMAGRAGAIHGHDQYHSTINLFRPFINVIKIIMSVNMLGYAEKLESRTFKVCKSKRSTSQHDMTFLAMWNGPLSLGSGEVSLAKCNIIGAILRQKCLVYKDFGSFCSFFYDVGFRQFRVSLS